LGPIEFCIYTLPLGAILRFHKINYHIYADDSTLYCSFQLDSPDEAIESMNDCLRDIRSWMIKNKLKINDDKTEFLLVTSPKVSMNKDLNVTVGNCVIHPSTSCKSLGVTIDCHVNMESQVNSICRSAHFHLRNIGSIRHLLTDSAAAQLVHALITSRLDYCNSLLYGLPDCRLNKLQRIQNIAARMVARTPKFDHITPVLRSLHWLPVRLRILFKLLLLVYRCVNETAPKYLCELMSPYRPSRSLRSVSQLLLVVPKCRLKTYGERAFSAAGPREWNNLPLHIKQSPTISLFKTNLKTFLFKSYFL